MQPIRNIDDLEAIKKLLKSQCDRDYFIFMIGVSMGFNCKDILYLKVKDVRGKSYLERGSSSTLRKVKIPLELKKELKHYIVGKKGEEYLFPYEMGKNEPITSRLFYKILKSAASELNISNVGGASMRQTYGYHLYKKYRNLKKVKDDLAQTELTDTLAYIGWDGEKGGD